MNSLATRRATSIVMLIGSITGFVASFVLTVDKIQVLKDSGYIPSCNISETLNCKSVMLSKQAEVFGFPNALIGIGAFAIFIAIGVALLAEVQFPKWFWQIAFVGTLSGVLFSHWLAYQTTFEIGALCPYCMVAWFGTTLILSGIIQELLRFKSANTEDLAQKESLTTISNFMPIFHLLWVGLLIAGAFLGVN
ncbi:MAG: vitamin K epoxide reductase family protein [Actinomycetales bacterium]